DLGCDRTWPNMQAMPARESYRRSPEHDAQRESDKKSGRTEMFSRLLARRGHFSSRALRALNTFAQHLRTFGLLHKLSSQPPRGPKSTPWSACAVVGKAPACPKMRRDAPLRKHRVRCRPFPWGRIGEFARRNGSEKIPRPNPRFPTK